MASMIKAIYILVGVAVVAALLSSVLGGKGNTESIASAVPNDIAEHILSKSNLIVLAEPEPLKVITNGESLVGRARGYWFFEASFPVILTNWDGLIIAETYATAEGDWMTEEFVPFTATLNFTSPYNPGDPDFMKNGSLILQKDNPSGLPEHDDALEIPIRFAP